MLRCDQVSSEGGLCGGSEGPATFLPRVSKISGKLLSQNPFQYFTRWVARNHFSEYDFPG